MLTLFGLNHRASAVMAAIATNPMGLNGLAAIAATDPLRRRQMIVRSPLVFHAFGGSSFWYWHDLAS